MKAFQLHLFEAITVNQERKKIYAKLTKNKSKKLSCILITMEKLSIPIAWYFDINAKKFQKKGIPIITNDFVSMQNIEKPENKLIYQYIAPDELIKTQKRNLTIQIRKIKLALKQNDLIRICDISSRILEAINKNEINYRCNFAMTKHITESMALIALHGIEYAKMSNNQTLNLTKRMIKAHIFVLNYTISFDKKCQKIHSQGVGFLINDLPYIPFLEEYIAIFANKQKTTNKK